MYIYYDDRFIERYLEIYHFIAEDSVNRAEIFEKELKNAMLNATHYPYKHRKSRYFASQNIRDLIFKGYTIPFKIDEDNNRLVILSIIKYRNNA